MFIFDVVSVWHRGRQERCRPHPHPVAPPHFLGDGFAFLLRQRCEDGGKHLAGALCRIDLLFLEQDDDAEPRQFPHCFQALSCVATEAGDGLYKDAVDASLSAVLHHPQEVLPLVDGSAGDALVSVDICQFPIWISCDELGEVGILRREGMRLIVGIRADAGVGRHAELSSNSRNICRDRNNSRRCQRQRAFRFFLAAHSSLTPPVQQHTIPLKSENIHTKMEGKSEKNCNVCVHIHVQPRGDFLRL